MTEKKHVIFQMVEDAAQKQREDLAKPKVTKKEKPKRKKLFSKGD